jgi:hypothetical protein
MTDPVSSAARRPVALRRVAAILASLVLVPAVLYALWDFIESERVAGRLDAAYPWVDTPDGRQPPGESATPDEQAAAALYAEAGRLATERGGRPFLESAQIIEALALLPPLQAAHDPRLEDLRRAEASYVHALEALDRAAARPAIPAIADLRALDVRRLASVNALRIARLAFSGDAAAPAALTSTLRLQRIPVSQMFLLRTVHSLQIVLQFAHAPESALAGLQREYEASQPAHGLEDHLESIRNQIVRMAVPEDFGAPGAGRGMTPVDAALFRLSRPIRNHRLAAELDHFAVALAAARLPWPKNLDEAGRLGRDLGLPRRFSGRRPSYLEATAPWADAAIGELARVAPLAAENLALARASIAALAIERYRLAHDGALPPSLAELVPAYLESALEDPFTGAELHYRRAAGRYVVYSAGLNRADDGGEWDVVSDLQTTRRGSPKDVGIAVGISPVR